MLNSVFLLLKTLRSALDDNGFEHIQIVASDDGWEISGDLLKDPALSRAVSIIGLVLLNDKISDKMTKSNDLFSSRHVVMLVFTGLTLTLIVSLMF